MRLGLGIDTGSTCTDAVLLDLDTDEVRATAKARTTHGDLREGILRAMDAVLEGARPEDVAAVAVSTTLATNAVVEGRGRPVGLVLIGWQPDKATAFPPGERVAVRGQFNARGEELEPLSIDDLENAAERLSPGVEGIAVCGYFSVRNPNHELAAKRVLQAQTGLPVVCGHELTSELGVYERAVTAMLNARIAPLVDAFLADIEAALTERGIAAPLMIVKSDGSLVDVAEAKAHPVETILSGPAASAIGGHRLAGIDDGLVVDIGGTTTDIVVLHRGFPNRNREGAVVGGWRTKVPAADIWTVGLGGDSHVRLAGPEEALRIEVGPRRVRPLALSDVPIDRLREADEPASAEFLRATTLTRTPERLDRNARTLLTLIPSDRWTARSQLWAEARAEGIYLFAAALDALDGGGWIQRAGFTPTDAFHVGGSYRAGDAERARAGAAALGAGTELSAEAFCERVQALLTERIRQELVKKLIADANPDAEFEGNPLWASLCRDDVPFLDVGFRLGAPVVGIGAPVTALLPDPVAALHGELIPVAHAAVGNAVGAISGRVVCPVETLVRQQSSQRYLLHFPDGRELIERASDEAAMRYALERSEQLAQREARRLGAESITVEVWERRFRFGLGRVRVAAVGRPGFDRRDGRESRG